MVLKYCSIQESLVFIGGCTFLPPATYCKGVQILFKHRWYVLVAAPFFLPQPIVKMVLRYCIFKHRWYVLVAAPCFLPQPSLPHGTEVKSFSQEKNHFSIDETPQGLK
jgi:hypothetical protein